MLIKSFKYFDLNDSGEVEPDEFAKAIEKIGIMIPTKQVSKSEAAGKRGALTLSSFFLFDINKLQLKILIDFRLNRIWTVYFHSTM